MKNLFVIFLLLFFFSFGQAQNSKVVTGITAYESGDYGKAIQSFDIALENSLKLKSANLPKAYYYRAKSNYKIFQKAVQEKDISVLNNSPLLEILEDFKSAEKNDNGKWAKKIEAEYQNLKFVLLQYGMLLVQSEDFKLAEKHFIALNSIEEDYVAYDYLGQIKNSQMDYPAAIKNLGKAVDLFKSKRPEDPDMFIAYTYYKKSMLHYYYSGEYSEFDEMYIPSEKDIDLAFASLTEGKKVLEEEYKRTLELKKDATIDGKARIENQYQSILGDLNNFELDLYLKTPDKLDEALINFEKAIEKEPNNYIIHVSYANLLEKNNTSKAIKMYEKAIEISPEEGVAYYSLGAIYINKSIDSYKKSNEEDDFNASDKLIKVSDEYLVLAKPLFEKCLEINPQSLEVINALKQISIRLNSVEEFKKYEQMGKELK